MKFVLKSALVFAGACLLASSTFAHSACWKMTVQYSSPATSAPPGFACFDGSATSDAYVEATGLTSFGVGAAFDNSITCEAEVRTAAVTGLYIMSWRNACSGRG